VGAIQFQSLAQIVARRSFSKISISGGLFLIKVRLAGEADAGAVEY